MNTIKKICFKLLFINLFLYYILSNFITFSFVYADDLINVNFYLCECNSVSLYYDVEIETNTLLSEIDVNLSNYIVYIQGDNNEYVIASDDYVITGEINFYLISLTNSIIKMVDIDYNFFSNIDNCRLLNRNYGYYSWSLVNHVECQNYSSYLINNISTNANSGIYNENELEIFINDSGGYDYGGCGPRAAIGILDYIGMSYDYPNILSDNTIASQRSNVVRLAVENIPTTILGSVENQMTLPSQYVSGFNNAMSSINYQNYISANYSDYTDSSQVTNSIDLGIPVSMMTLFMSGTDDLQFHWINIFGYCVYTGLDDEGNEITKIIYMCRSNYECDHNDSCYLVLEDAFFINFNTFRIPLSCIVNYNITKTLKILPSDLGLECRYNNTESNSSFVIDDDNSCDITFLRTGYVNHYDSTNTIVDGQYLVLSCIKTGIDTAYLEYNLESSNGFSIRYLDIYLSLWGENEYINYRDYIYSCLCIDYYDNGMWYPAEYIQLDLLSTDILDMDHFVVDLEEHNNFRIYLDHSNVINSTRNKGRIVVGDIILYD